ncbi:hypothetical protein B7P43_G07349 [Cryptotermes secundus]|uniref:Midnolin n=2 Tax=Cryptotermes secundus TaxID=105785 RepID=A0A2J7PMY5_9NEOP|nr:hypothetical protein B7P43_G07349 [Cryptotermes secundus]
MRLGDHMMLIQLQLSTVTPSSSRRSASTNSNTNTSTSSTNSTLQSHLPILPSATSAPAMTGSNNTTSCNTPSSTSPATVVQPSVENRCHGNSASDSTAPQYHIASPTTQTCSKSNTSLSQISVSAASPSPLLVSSRNSVMTASQLSVVSSGKNTSHSTSTDSYRHHLQQKVSHQNSSAVSVASESSKLSVSSSSTTDDKYSSPSYVPPRRLLYYYTKSSSSNTDTSSEVAQSSNTSESSHRTVQQHLVQSPLKSLENATNNLSLYTSNNASNIKLPASQTTSDNASNHGPLTSTSVHACTSPSSVLSCSSATSGSALCKCEPTTAAKPTLDTRALAEASRNLTQTLKQLSSEVLTSRSDPAEDSARARRQGAIIESMHHHGKGVYSGTFSGTLNPALQDRFGRPKRDISTIIHILNDLLCATPQYRRHARQGHTITLEASSGNPPKSGSSGGSSLVSADSRTAQNIDFMEESLTLSQENQATRGKMEQLRLIMQERRARRRARREARLAPYTLTQWSAKSESLSTQQNPAGGPGSGAGSLGTHGDEPMDTTGSSAGEQHVCELNPPEPVVA